MFSILILAVFSSGACTQSTFVVVAKGVARWGAAFYYDDFFFIMIFTAWASKIP